MVVFRIGVFRALFRNLAIGAMALAGLCWGLSAVEILQFLEEVRGPAAVASGVCWLLYYLLRIWEETRPEGHTLASAQGPGGELTQKATLYGFRQQGGYQEGDEAEACFRRGEQRFAEGRYAEAARHYQESAEARPSLPAYLNWGASLLNVAQFSQAGEVLRIGLQLARRQQQREFEAGFQADLGALFLHQGKLQAGWRACQEARELFGHLREARGEADALLSMGNVRARQGDWEAAQQAYAEALKEYEELDHTLGCANALANLGNAHVQREDFAAALKHCRAALSLHEGIGNLLGQANTLTNLGNAHFRQGRLEEARRVYEAALALCQQVGDPLGQANALTNLGNVHFRQGRLEEALHSYEQALRIHQERGDVLGRAHTLTNIGSLYARQRRLEEALEVLEQARVLYLDVGARGRGLEAVEKVIARLKRRLAKPPRKKGGESA